MTINSDQVNYLVLRYLVESGFEHTAFSLKNEMRNAQILEDRWATKVSTGLLVDHLQKALMFEECLAQIDENGGEKEPADVLPTSLIPADAGEIEPKGAESSGSLSKRKVDATERSTSIMEKRRRSPVVAAAPETNGSVRDHVMLDASTVRAPPREVVKKITSVVTLEGHTAGLDQCLWHPTQQHMLATSSTDGTARIWTLPGREDETIKSVVLNCLPSRTPDKSVTAIAFNSNGNLIATGSYDGVARIWTMAGSKPYRDLTFHAGPIFAMKWSRREDFLLTGAADGMIGVWNSALGTLQQKWDLRSPVMDIEWISDALFLSACKDGSLRMWQLGRDANVKHFIGHDQDISVLKWNSNINLGATASDEAIVKVWRADSENPTQVLKYHRAAIHALEWAPKDYGDYRILASASRDGQVCIWDVVRGELLHTLHHDRPIFTIHFSPTNLLATAGEQGETTVWNAESGKMVAVHDGRDFGTVYNMKFSVNGERLGLARGKNVATILTIPSS